MTKSTTFLCVLTLAPIMACAPAATGSTRALRDSRLITEQEITAANESNAYDVVAKLRPNFLKTRGRATINASASEYASVFLDGQLYGDLSALHNVAALDTLLDDDLTYVHTGGDLQSRDEFLDMIKKQTLVYESIAPSEVRVRVYDGLAVATGRSQQRVRNASGVQNFAIRFIEVYVRRDARWRLAAWEATRLTGS